MPFFTLGPSGEGQREYVGEGERQRQRQRERESEERYVEGNIRGYGDATQGTTQRFGTVRYGYRAAAVRARYDTRAPVTVTSHAPAGLD